MLNYLVYFALMDRCLILQFSKVVGKIKDAISALAVAIVDDDNDEVTARSPPEVPRDSCLAL